MQAEKYHRRRRKYQVGETQNEQKKEQPALLQAVLKNKIAHLFKLY